MRNKYCPHYGNFGVWGIFGITLIYVFQLTFQKRLFNFEKLVCHINFVLADKTSRVAALWGGRCVDNVLLL